MKSFISALLLVVGSISFVLTLIFAAFGIYDEIMGPAKAEKLLKKLHIPLTYNQAVLVIIVTVVIMMLSFGMRAKLLGKL